MYIFPFLLLIVSGIQGFLVANKLQNPEGDYSLFSVGCLIAVLIGIITGLWLVEETPFISVWLSILLALGVFVGMILIVLVEGGLQKRIQKKKPENQPSEDGEKGE